ncbi:Conserved oligomeric Golgi complex subunit 5 [Lasallia pustulata]|uniref:Conserved oligomeric Golgi complex subunit 5 n=1 Tax=Lasallia pustulata TaxID=136370 RepID=A0A1W5CRX8_9LECA|nr:Conserved oligomeric Golgi complex subunit 5 [Lasallia pustulata]
MTDAEPSYIDYEAFLDPSFSPTLFANTLVTATNNPSDTPLDLSTPLSRVLFDVQEIDTHIHTLTTQSALPLLSYTKDQIDASQRIVKEVETQVASLTDGYQRLEKEVIQRHEAADEVRLAAERLWQTVNIGRAVGRCLLLGRQLDAQMAELRGDHTGRKEDHRAMVRASNTLLTLRQLFAATKPGEEGEFLNRIHVIVTLQTDLIHPSEQRLRSKAQQIIREFSMSSLPTSSTTTPSPDNRPTYAQSEETKSRTTSALLTLYLISPTPTEHDAPFQPSLLLAALQSYLQTSLTSSLASLARALSTLPTLDRTLVEVSARCQNIVALESLLESIKLPLHPLLAIIPGPRHQLTAIGMPDGKDDVSPAAPSNLLQPLRAALDTSSLPSYFWRSLAEGLSGRVQEIVNRGGVSARTLKSQRERVREALRDCVLRGARVPGQKEGREGNWEREAAVMGASVVGALGR